MKQVRNALAELGMPYYYLPLNDKKRYCRNFQDIFKVIIFCETELKSYKDMDAFLFNSWLVLARACRLGEFLLNRTNINFVKLSDEETGYFYQLMNAFSKEDEILEEQLIDWSNVADKKITQQEYQNATSSQKRSHLFQSIDGDFQQTITMFANKFGEKATLITNLLKRLVKRNYIKAKPIGGDQGNKRDSSRVKLASPFSLMKDDLKALVGYLQSYFVQIQPHLGAAGDVTKMKGVDLTRHYQPMYDLLVPIEARFPDNLKMIHRTPRNHIPGDLDFAQYDVKKFAIFSRKLRSIFAKSKQWKLYQENTLSDPNMS
uniref:Uncharacterized protein n=1 Tax=Aplanochytrium stocchinoi TaxID=215587 RepID=A0A7S3PER9_9STRA